MIRYPDMENRTLLAIVLSFLVLFIYQLFFAPAPGKKVTPKPVPQTVQQQPTAQQNVIYPRKSNDNVPGSKIIYVSTPFYNAELSTNNFTIMHWYLKDYRTELEKTSPPVEVIGRVKGVAYPMWESFDGSSFTMSSNISYACSALSATIKDTDNHEQIACSHRAGSIGIKKVITFYGNSYTATVTLELTNYSDKPVVERLGVNWSGLSGELGSRYDIADGIVLINNSRETIEAKSLNLSKSYDGIIQWFGLENRYFIQTVLPHEPEQSHLYAARINKPENGLIPLLLTYVYNPVTVGPHSTGSKTYTIFLGPKDIDFLNRAGSHLGRALYFGWSDVIAKPLFYVMKFINRFVGNYGWTIFILTILIRIILFPIGQIGFKSMRQMQKIAPKINELKEKYKNDKERLYRETTNLYRSYKINPLGGCLPMLMQIPIFFALYEVLLLSIELRHAPFIWWINDLSAPDTIGTVYLAGMHIGIHILPLIMGVTMLFQQLLTPTTASQAQAKMMIWLMPIVLTVLFWGFPAGLVLYWTVNNIFSIGQQYYILKKY